MFKVRKQIWAGLLIIAMITSLTACGDGTSGSTILPSNTPIASDQQPVQSENDIEPLTPETEQQPEIVQETIEEKAKAAMETLEVWDGAIAESFDGGDGSKENPYQIANGAQLTKLAMDTNQGAEFEDTYFILTSDIMLNDITKWDFNEPANNIDLAEEVVSIAKKHTKEHTGGGWHFVLPIGSMDRGREFKGTFDGCGHTIYGYGLTLFFAIGLSSTGLFGCVYDGDIRNLNLACCIFTPDRSENVGSIAGTIYYGTIDNCHTEQMMIIDKPERDIINLGLGSVKNTYTRMGGICGNTIGAKIINSTAEGIICCEIDTDDEGDIINQRPLYIGGIAGSAYSEDSSVEACFGKCDIIINAAIMEDDSQGKICVGGICGLGGSVLYCYNTGDINVQTNLITEIDGNIDEKSEFPVVEIGGIAGQINGCVSNCGSVSKLAYSGNIESTFIGGICGTLANAEEPSEASYCYSDVKMEGGNTGGISGCTYGKTTIKNCYYNENSAEKAAGTRLKLRSGNLFTDQIKALSEEELRDSNNYYNWDFFGTWFIDNTINDGLPMPLAFSPRYLRKQ